MHRSVLSLVLSSLLVGSVMLPVRVARAQAADPMEEAKRHFVQGVALFNDGNFSAALAEFESAYKVRPSPGVLYNIGLTQKALFRYTDAIETLTKYLEADPKLAPERKGEVTQLITEMRALLAEVTLDVQPAGANILLDGRTVATAPITKPMGIAAGNHVIEVTMDGYKARRKEIIVTAGVAMTIKIALDLIPKSAKVHIAARPTGATIIVDGNKLGTSNVDIELATGGHQLEIEKSGYARHKSELVIAAGQDRDVKVELEKRFYKKASFWVPVSLVLAAGIAVGVAVPLTTVPSTLEGTLFPFASKVNP